jgi:hypothetical protein
MTKLWCTQFLLFIPRLPWQRFLRRYSGDRNACLEVLINFYYLIVYRSKECAAIKLREEKVHFENVRYTTSCYSRVDGSWKVDIPRSVITGFSARLCDGYQMCGPEDT